MPPGIIPRYYGNMPGLLSLLASFLTLAGLWLTPAPASAIEEMTPEPGLPYRVTGVASNDRLNIRETPGTDGRLVGSLAPSAANIAVTGERMEVGGSVWWALATDNRGWVNARFLTPMNSERKGNYPLWCGGTEPFWSLAVQDGQARFTRPDHGAVLLQAGPWRLASGALETFALQLRSGPKTGYAAVTRTYRFCSDGMSDIQYPFETIVILPGGDVLAGCCRRDGS